MLISLNWIKDYVNLDGIEVDELVKRFGLSTAEVEGLEYKGRELENIVVAEILSVENHPESQKLHILKVNDGSGEPIQVVCGAPNVRVGLKTYFARVGGNVNGLKIKPAKLAGIDSFGMCCGGNELGIEADTSGIVELDSDLVVGTDIKDILPVEDVIIEVDNKSLTNRPDLWGHYGIAREFAAEAWPGHEILVATHLDTKNPHSHFVINSVSFENGYKLRQDTHTLEHLREKSDRICMSHGYSIIKNPQKRTSYIPRGENRAAQRGNSWKFALMWNIDQAMKKSGTRKDFVQEMKRRGYDMIWTDARKSITFPPVLSMMSIMSFIPKSNSMLFIVLQSQKI